MTEPFRCKDCNQSIIFHQGLNLVVNFYDGEGGYKGDRHLCPYRSGSNFDKKNPGHGDLSYFLHHGYPSLQKHYDNCFQTGMGLQQLCGDPDCICARIHAMKDPIKFNEWEQQRRDWLIHNAEKEKEEKGKALT